MLVTENHKYCCFYKGRLVELLFDLKSDPGERQNLSRDTAFSETLAALRSALLRWCEECDDPFASYLRDYSSAEV